MNLFKSILRRKDGAGGGGGRVHYNATNAPGSASGGEFLDLEVTLTPLTSHIAIKGMILAEVSGAYHVEVRAELNGEDLDIGGNAHYFKQKGSATGFVTVPYQKVVPVTPGVPVTIKLRTRDVDGAGVNCPGRSLIVEEVVAATFTETTTEGGGG